MTKMYFPLVTALALNLLPLSTASAFSVFSTRYGTANTNVAIGVVNGKVSVVEQRLSDGACAIQAMTSNNTVPSTGIRFTSGGGANRIRVVQGQASSSTLCGYSITPFQTDHPLQIMAGAGDDIVLIVTSSRSTRVWGEAGNDIIISDNSGYGGDGNDVIVITDADGTTQQSSGDLGDDWLCDFGDGSQFIGGPGYDRVWNQTPDSEDYEEVLSSGDPCLNVYFWAGFTYTF